MLWTMWEQQKVHERNEETSKFIYEQIGIANLTQKQYKIKRTIYFNKAILITNSVQFENLYHPSLHLH